MPIVGLSCWERPLDTILARGERHHLLSATYTAALTAAGATPVILPSVEPALADLAVSRVDGLIISGGGDIDPARYAADNTDSTDLDPIRDAWEFALVEAARRRDIPLLGICRGLQVLNVALGGSLRQHVWGSADHAPLWNQDRTQLATGHHDVALGGPLRELYGKDSRRVNSLHHQGVARLGDELEVVATAGDGGVEAVVSTGRWTALAVQWHPERLDLADEQPLFRWITERASG